MKVKNIARHIKESITKKDRELIQESLRYKITSVNMENNDFETKLFLLKLEYQKKYKELMLNYNTDRNKLISQHQNRLRQLSIN